MKVPYSDPHEVVFTTAPVPAPERIAQPAPSLLSFLAPAAPANPPIPHPSSAMLVHPLPGGGTMFVRNGRVHLTTR